MKQRINYFVGRPQPQCDMLRSMNRLVVAFAVFLTLFAERAIALTDADVAQLKQLTKDYAAWDFSGRPVEFRERLDYESFEDQRGSCSSSPSGSGTAFGATTGAGAA